MKEYFIQVSGNAPSIYPTDTYFGLVWYDELTPLEIPKKIPYCGEWGDALTTICQLRETYPLPYKISIAWLSLVEEKSYFYEANIPSEKIEKLLDMYDGDEEPLFSHIVVGMAPCGYCAIWTFGLKKSTIILWEKAIEMINIKGKITHQHCQHLINALPMVKRNLERFGLPSLELFTNYMKQFIYRYLVIFKQWNEDNLEWMDYDERETISEFDYIEEALFDGTHDKLHDGGLLNYHLAGKPKKLSVAWHVNKSEYTAYFWFEDEAIRNVFDRFYGAHPDTKTDFMIRIDAEKKKYELALYRYGLKEPVIISPSAYQLLVFKNKFECYRSENYNQPKGAWIW